MAIWYPTNIDFCEQHNFNGPDKRVIMEDKRRFAIIVWENETSLQSRHTYL